MRELDTDLYTPPEETYRLRLLRLECHETEDWRTDEIYIVVNGSILWAPHDMREGHSENLSDIPEIEFRGHAVIKLYDQDTHIFGDDDDFLGSHTVSPLDADGTTKRAYFTGDGANYMIEYEVTREIR